MVGIFWRNIIFKALLWGVISLGTGLDCARAFDLELDSTLVITEDFKQAPVGRYVSILAVQNKPSLAKIMRDSINYPFKTNYEDVLKLTTQAPSSAYWLTFHVRNDTEQAKEFILEIDNPLVEELEFFEINEKIDRHYYTGNRFEFKTRPINHRNFLFKVSLAPQQDKIYYAYLNQQGKDITLPVKLYTPESFLEANYKSQMILGLTNGFFFFALLLAIFMYWNLQRLNFLNFSFYILTLWLFALDNAGLAYQYLWGNYPAWGQYSVYVLAYLNAFFAVVIVYRYLTELRLMQPILPWILYVAYFCAFWAFLSVALVYFENSLIQYFTGGFPLWLMSFVNAVLITGLAFGMYKKPNSLAYWGLAIYTLLFMVEVYFWIITPITENIYTGIFFNFGCGSVLVAVFWALSYQIRYFYNEEELQNLLSRNKLIALYEQKGNSTEEIIY